METFNDLQSIWNQQPGVNTTTTASDLIKKSEEEVKRLKMGQFITISILSTLTIVLIGYFIWVGAHQLNELTIGLGVMISVILIRILIEWISVNKLKAIKADSTMIVFGHKMEKFYLWRRRIHVFIVPVIYLSYTFGFIVLLPSFQANLSYGMYLYVLISGFVSLVVLAFFIARQIKKETRILNLLRRM
ncbi:MAG TPA: hypothetical protein VD884_00280 [Ohtaekwangia sp.]|nr:hypothetical protein [Ohtaekwangia sp.]